mgnify:CR=1 FL=1
MNIETIKDAAGVQKIIKESDCKIENLDINGTHIGLIGYANDADKKAAEELLTKLVEGTKSMADLYYKLKVAVDLMEHDINIDKVFDFNSGGNVKIVIDARKRKAYVYDVMSQKDPLELANLEDLKSVKGLSDEDVCTLLKERALAVLQQ